MNTYKKYCPNVFVAKCESTQQKGDIITITTKHGHNSSIPLTTFNTSLQTQQ